ncbi:hypothetical protein [Saccharothrix syringae]|uniref:Uncharacterized protein n=1 Tax=Saccharothrix syringae TaxID=103733 RepID=A0A5Q0H219_SACSY|nr:hypothetical protein [Saccharothrix syringae]QFZ20179.1 hypothetical protein EKG83_24670 [Saccharothrix syringae]
MHRPQAVPGRGWGAFRQNCSTLDLRQNQVLSTAGVDIGDSLTLVQAVDPSAPAYTWTFTLL